MKDSASARYLLWRIGEGLSTNGLLDVSSVSSQTENVAGSSRPIAHEKIEYLARFKGKSSRQVRDKVLQLLILRCGPTLDPGEI